jgi:hypothetical protein
MRLSGVSVGNWISSSQDRAKNFLPPFLGLFSFSLLGGGGGGIKMEAFLVVLFAREEQRAVFALRLSPVCECHTQSEQTYTADKLIAVCQSAHLLSYFISHSQLQTL